MTGAVNQKRLMAALVGGVAGAMLLATPVVGKAAYANADDGRNGAWVDHLTEFVAAQQKIAQANGAGGMFDLYFDGLTMMRILVGMRDQKSTYMLMNHFMDMLEARQGGISAEAAEAIWDYCYRVTPPALHDIKRHKMWWDKTVDWESFFWRE